MSYNRISFDLSVIRKNYHIMKGLCADTSEVTSVLKANAYGLGLQQVAVYLESCGVGTFFVATVNEGVIIRKSLPKVNIYILSDFLSEHLPQIFTYNLIPVINSLDDMKWWINMGYNQPSAIHIDTGFHRLGMMNDEWDYVLQHPDMVDKAHTTLFISHLSHSDNKEYSARQLQSFLKKTQPFPHVKKSLAATNMFVLGKEYHLDMVRLGSGLLGGNIDFIPGLKNPYSLYCRILKIFSLQANQFIGYHQEFVTTKPSTFMTISMGYADGILWKSKGSSLNVYVQGVACPVVGRLSMDTMVADITHVLPSPKVGDDVEILGPHQNIVALAKDLQSIPDDVNSKLLAMTDRR